MMMHVDDVDLRIKALELASDSLKGQPVSTNDILRRADLFETFLSAGCGPATTMPKKPEQPD